MQSSKGSRRGFWRQVVARQRGSGLSIKAFCAQEGLAAATFFAWKRRLGTVGAPATVGFASVRVQPEAAPECAAGGMEILLPHDRRVRLTGAVDRQQLITVLAALAE
jgi:hypothetical protein